MFRPAAPVWMGFGGRKGVREGYRRAVQSPSGALPQGSATTPARERSQRRGAWARTGKLRPGEGERVGRVFPEPKEPLVLLQLATEQVVDALCLEGAKQLLVEDPGVHTHDHRHIVPIALAQERHRVLHHLARHLPRVAVLLATREQGIHHVRAPGELQRLNPLYLLLRGFTSLLGMDLVAVHHHGVQAQHRRRRCLLLQAPQEQLAQQVAKHPDAAPPKPAEEALKVHEDPRVADVPGEQRQRGPPREGATRHGKVGTMGGGGRGRIARKRGLGHLAASPGGLSAVRAAAERILSYASNLAQRVSSSHHHNPSNQQGVYWKHD